MPILDRYTHETFTVDDWAAEVLGEVYHQSDAIGLVKKLQVPGELSGGKIFIRKYGELEAYNFLENRKLGLGVSYSNTTKDQIEISLDEFPDISIGLANEDIRFGIFGFDDQFIKPAARGIVRRLNDKALNLRKGAKKFLQVDVDAPAKAFAQVSYVFDHEGHDTSNLRSWSPDWLTLQLRLDEAVRNASRSGNGGRTLVRGEIGALNGIDSYNMSGLVDGVGIVYDYDYFGGVILTTTSTSSSGGNVSVLDAIRNKQWVDSTVDFDGITLHVSGAPSFEQKGYGFSHDCLAGAGFLNQDKAILLVPKGTTKQQLVDIGYSEELVDVTPTNSIFAIGGTRTVYPGPTTTDTTVNEQHIAGAPTPTGNLGKGQVLRNKETAAEAPATTAPATGSGTTGS